MKTIANDRLPMSSSCTSLETNLRSSKRSTACFRCLFRMTYSLAAAIRLAELKRVLAREVLRAVGFIGADDSLYQRMPDDIAFVEMNERDTLDSGNHVPRFDQTGHLSERQIDLRDVARDDGLAAVADSCQEHLHLLGCRVLRFIEDDERIIQRPAAHERDRSDFNHTTFEVAINPFDIDHVVQGVV